MATVFFIVILVSGCNQKMAEERESFEKSVNPEIVQINPKKPARIELRRNANKKYSWVLRGEDVEEIISIDRRLREQLGGVKDNKSSIQGR
jgi:hypothetical protein